MGVHVPRYGYHAASSGSHRSNLCCALYAVCTRSSIARSQIGFFFLKEKISLRKSTAVPVLYSCVHGHVTNEPLSTALAAALQSTLGARRCGFGLGPPRIATVGHDAHGSDAVMVAWSVPDAVAPRCDSARPPARPHCRQAVHRQRRGPGERTRGGEEERR